MLMKDKIFGHEMDFHYLIFENKQFSFTDRKRPLWLQLTLSSIPWDIIIIIFIQFLLSTSSILKQITNKEEPWNKIAISPYVENTACPCLQ